MDIFTAKHILNFMYTRHKCYTFQRRTNASKTRAKKNGKCKCFTWIWSQTHRICLTSTNKYFTIPNYYDSSHIKKCSFFLFSFLIKVKLFKWQTFCVCAERILTRTKNNHNRHDRYRRKMKKAENRKRFTQSLFFSTLFSFSFFPTFYVYICKSTFDKLNKIQFWWGEANTESIWH